MVTSARSLKKQALYAFDLIELNGDDLRHDPLEVRKATPANILARADRRIWFNDHIQDDGPIVFKHACKLGLESIVSKRKDSPYRGRPLSRLAQVEEPGLRSGEAGKDMRVFVAGATGAVGSRLIPLLVSAGPSVLGLTRTPGKAEAIRRAGADVAIVDALDGVAVRQAVVRAKPDGIVHGMTALSGVSDLRR
jgi:hypothetical protein